MGMQEDIAQNARNINDLDVRVQMIEKSESNAKPWFMSKGVMGPALSMAAKIAAVIAYMQGIDPEIVLTILGVSGAGDVVGAVGRAVATKRIK